VEPLLVTVAAWTSFATLAASGLAHARRPLGLIRALREQRVWPHPLHVPLAAGVVVCELGIGLAGLTASLAGASDGTLRGLLLAAASLYAVYAAYGAFLLSRHSTAPCGCSPGDDPVNVWVALRAAALGAAAALAFSAPERTLSHSAPLDELALAGLATAAFAVVLWALPAAMHDAAGAALSPAPAGDRP
jgi:hypothetical protein